MNMMTLTASQRGIAQHLALQVRDEIGYLGFSTVDLDRKCSAEQAEYAFKRLAETLGYRVEPIAAPAATVRTDVPVFKPRVGLSETGVPV